MGAEPCLGAGRRAWEALTHPPKISPYYTLVNVNGYLGTHSGYDIFTTIALKRNNHGNALPNFRKVAAGIILGGQE